jgi:PAS domain S-box-containing protein
VTGVQTCALPICQDSSIRHTFYNAQASVRPGLHLVIFRDLTESVLAERALRESEREFRAMIDASPDMVFRTTIRGVFEYMSPAATAILGYEPEELVGTPSRAIIHPDDFGAAAEGYGQALAGQANSFRVRVRRKDGGYTWTETRRSLLGTPEKPIGIVTVVREIEIPVAP